MLNFQGMAVEQGADFRNECLKALKYAGFELTATEMHLEDVGITLDAVTNNRSGIAFAWEFKGSLQGKRPGLVRTDTVKKAIANGWLLRKSAKYSEFFPPLFLMRSHEPDKGDARAMLDVAIAQNLFTDVVDSRDGIRLRWLANATEESIQQLLDGRRE